MSKFFSMWPKLYKFCLPVPVLLVPHVSNHMSLTHQSECIGTRYRELLTISYRFALSQVNLETRCCYHYLISWLYP